jgi:hypothetical protein
MSQSSARRVDDVSFDAARFEIQPVAPEPYDHLLELYEDDVALIDALEQFAASGLEAGDGVVVIAREEHLRSLHFRLGRRDTFLEELQREQYLPVDAEKLLGEFMDDGWPDSARFHAVVHDLLARARGQGRNIRAFGEMVALLWERGEEAAVVRLEQLWERLRRSEGFVLLCAYPAAGFAAGNPHAADEVRDTHTRLRAL